MTPEFALAVVMLTVSLAMTDVGRRVIRFGERQAARVDPWR